MRWRDSPQPLLPKRKPTPPAGEPDIYPSHRIASGAIQSGYAALAAIIARRPVVLIDGYCGVFWSELREGLEAAGVRANWIATADFLKSEPAIERMLAPFLGGDDPLFGKRFTGELADFFMATPPPSPLPNELERGSASIATSLFAGGEVSPHRYGGRFRGGSEHKLSTIIYGCGAFLFGAGFRVYIDLPKNEAQYRSRAGLLSELGRADCPTTPRRSTNGCTLWTGPR